MQGRMKQHQLSTEEINDVLKSEQVGRIATHNENGYPYIVPVHYVVYDEKIYIHGLIKGQKISILILTLNKPECLYFLLILYSVTFCKASSTRIAIPFLSLIVR